MKPTLAIRRLLLASTLLAAANSAHAINLYWDLDDATPGAGGTTPSDIWTTDGKTWSTSPDGTVATSALTTTLLSDLFFSAGVNATGAYTIDLTTTQQARSLTFRSGTPTIGGDGVIDFGATGSGIIRVNNLYTTSSPKGEVPINATIGNGTSTVIAGSVGLTKTGVGLLNLSSSAVHTFTGGLHVNGGTLNLNFANLADPTNMIDSGNALSFGGGNLLITGKNSGTTSQTLGNVTVNSGGGAILGNKNGGDALDITLGSLTATAKGGSLLLGAGGTAANIPVISTTTDKDVSGIYGGRTVYFNGTANTGYDWTTNTGGAGPYTLAAYTGYTAMASSGADTNNSRITASHTLDGNLTTNSLKFENPATAQTLTIGAGNTLTLESGGLLITGNSVAQGPRIAGGSITAGNGSGSFDLVVHSYNVANQKIARGVTGVNLALVTTISSNIVDNGSDAVTLVKAGPGDLLLTGANTFTGGIVVNGGNLALNSAGALNNNHITFNANSTLYTAAPSTTSRGITLNNNSQLLILNNNSSFSVNGAVTGDGGISVAHGGQGSITVNLNSTNNTFTGPIRYEHSQFNQSAHVTVGSLMDTDTYGAGNITFGLPGNATSHNFNYGSTANAPLVLNNRQFELAGSVLPQQSINNNSSQAVTINSDLLTSGTDTKTLTLGGTGAGLSTFAGDIANGTITTLNITKGGSGTWVLSGDNSYNGTTTVNAGKLLINGDSSLATGNVNVTGSGTTFGGTGITGGAVSVAANSILAPGASIGSLGVGTLNMATGSTFAYEVANNSSTGADLLAVGGTISLSSVTLGLDAASLAALSGGGWSLGDKLTLISYFDAGAGITSGFTGYLDDTSYFFGTNEWFFDYNDTTAGGNYTTDATAASQNYFVTMTLIPEPRAALLGGLGLLMLLRRRRVQ